MGALIHRIAKNVVFDHIRIGVKIVAVEQSRSVVEVVVEVVQEHSDVVEVAEEGYWIDVVMVVLFQLSMIVWIMRLQLQLSYPPLIRSHSKSL